jgi:phage head maturation protease
MIKRLAAAIALALPLSAFALSNSFSYQGSLNDGGSPASGSYDLQFQLQTSAGANVGAPLVREDVAVSGGLFSVELDFGAAITSGDFRLQIGVRPGASTGAFTTLSPATNIRPTPQAQVAGLATEAVTVSPNAITSASIVDGAVTGADIQDGSIAGIDIQDGGITTVDIADGSILALDVDTTLIQARVNNSCLAGSAIRAIGQGGAVTCETIPAGGSGTVTSVASGAGLSGGPITTSGTLSIATGGVTSAMIADGTVANTDLAANAVNSGNIVDGSIGSADINTAQVQARVGGTCAAGSSIRDISATGTVTCEADDGTVTSVASGAGLTGGPITTTGTLSIATGGVTSAMIADGTVANTDLAANAVNSGNIVDGSIGSADINTAQVQARVSGSCAAGSSISTIAANGTVTCETDDTGPPGWQLAGNAGTNPSTQFIGTTDAQALVLRTQNVRSLRIEPSAVLVGGVPITTNTITGSSANSVTSGVRGATIAGGGTLSGNVDPDLTGAAPNQVTDHYGVVGGGSGNSAGNGFGTLIDAAFATVAGGQSNRASDEFATVGGGSVNAAIGEFSTVSGGRFNTAVSSGSAIGGGDNNEARGSNATVPGGAANCAGGVYSFAAGRNAKVRPAVAPVVGACSSLPSYPGGNGDQGTFVWGDSQAANFVSTGPNQFLVRADGGVMINTNTLPASGDDLVLRARTSGDTDVDIKLLTQNGTAGLIYLDEGTGSFFLSPQGVQTGQPRLNVTGGSGGVATLSNGGTWTNASSRSYKTGFVDVDPLAILNRLVALPISTWTYRGSEEGTHLGPMAEDFKAAFDLAGDGKSIATVDADGVALAAIQGLNQKLESENAALRAELAELRALVLQTIRD